MVFKRVLFFFKMDSSLSAELTNIYNILKVKQFLSPKKLFSPYCLNNAPVGYWMNKLLPPNVKEYNKWFGDNVQNCHNGVVILLPTFFSFSKFYRSFTYQELVNIILNPDNYVFVSNDVNTTNIDICCQWDAEVLSLNGYINYLVERGLSL